ncbi:ABC-2 type transport system permease protein [Paenibacillus phyllosphaerae]|uniref:ABC-2 type transport system permease protein n=1 Tax=Paenibacillus phyllosphaerae TaxID=274593 RepID=A0A7W5B526_9BACL|nr:ABC transporter permease [Paenibacillus phyllosphaerae]MBB3114547.1 ABC-2 type transport system permease protein [Paenibacillus phyllosphaerae]
MNSSFWTVVGFTVKNKFRGKAFLITTLIIALIISIGINLPYIISQFTSGDDEAKSIGYIAHQQQDTDEGAFGEARIASMLSSYYEAQETPDLKLVPIADTGSAEGNEEALKQAIEAEAVKGYIQFTPGTVLPFPDVVYKSEKLMDTNVTRSLETALQAVKTEAVLQNSGISQEQRTLLLSEVNVSTVQITTSEGAGSVGQGKSASEQAMDMGLVYVILILLFMAIMITGQLIASEITAEKSSRVMEILITSVSPLKSMFGKIFGMFLVGLTQVLVYVGIIVLNMALPHNAEPLSDLNIRLADINPVLLVYALVFYLAGYFLFATLFAAVGSIVSRTEDLGQAVLPITMISLAGFYICMFGGLSNPDSMLMKVASLIPLFSPYAMTVRLGLSDPAMWEVWTSIILLLIAIYVAGWISARIYRAGVLMYGKRPSLKELRKAMKAYKV